MPAAKAAMMREAENFILFWTWLFVVERINFRLRIVIVAFVF